MHEAEWIAKFGPRGMEVKALRAERPACYVRLLALRKRLGQEFSVEAVNTFLEENKPIGEKGQVK